MAIRFPETKGGTQGIGSPRTDPEDNGGVFPAPPATGGIGGVVTKPLPPTTPATPTTPTTPTTPATPGTPAAPTTPAAPGTGFNSSGDYTPQSDSVSDQVNRITSANSPLMQRAAGIGAAVANSRGLQNSTLASQSAQKAMLDAAVPIASQDAQQAYGKNLQFMQGKTQTEISAMQTAAATQASFSQSLLASSQSYSANVSAIMSNPDLSASARKSALDAAAKQRDADFNMVQRVYGVSISGTGGSNTLTWNSGAAAAGGA